MKKDTEGLNDCKHGVIARTCTQCSLPFKGIGDSIYDAKGQLVCKWARAANRDLIVNAVNSHAELLADAEINAEWFEREGYPTEAENIRRLIAKAKWGK